MEQEGSRFSEFETARTLLGCLEDVESEGLIRSSSNILVDSAAAFVGASLRRKRPPSVRPNAAMSFRDALAVPSIG